MYDGKRQRNYGNEDMGKNCISDVMEKPKELMCNAFEIYVLKHSHVSGIMIDTYEKNYYDCFLGIFCAYICVLL
jgi:hypothetical protein